MSSSCRLKCTCLLLAKNQMMHKCLSVSADDILYPWAVISLCVYLQVSWNISIFLCVSCLSWSLQATEILVPRFLGGWGDGTAGFFFGTDQERFTHYYWKSAKSAPALCSPPSQPHQFFQFFRRRVAQHQLLSSGGCKFKKEKTSSNGCFMYWECCSAFLLYTRPKKVQMSFGPAWFLFPTS